MPLTGRYRYRLGWRRRLVLQVEHTFKVSTFFTCPPPPDYPLARDATEWRDATIEDLQEIDDPVLVDTAKDSIRPSLPR
ncbi:hypothetical protein [Shinella sp.]|uniref:hypothetical protein n=1 Tax=Shinella sp. TaxID=1870904 RepID=UPI0039E531E7